MKIFQDQFIPTFFLAEETMILFKGKFFLFGEETVRKVKSAEDESKRNCFKSFMVY